jgi:hypothetical protein
VPEAEASAVAERERARDLAARLESELAATQQVLAQLVLAVQRDPDGPTAAQTAALVRAETVLDGAEVEL